MFKLNRREVIILVIGIFLATQIVVLGQTPAETPPPPSAPPTVNIPEVKEMTLPNGLKVVVIQRRGVPLVTASLLIRSGANAENEDKAGLADMTASLLTKGTGEISSTQIAEQIEFLGASIGSGAGWNSSSISINTMNSSLGRALSIMSNSAIRPSFPKKEIDLLKKQELDGFNVSLKQPGSLLSYVASRYTFGEHLSGGTPETIKRLTRKNIVDFHQENYRPNNAVLIFTGDVTDKTAFGFARLFFGGWTDASKPIDARGPGDNGPDKTNETSSDIVNRLLVVDLPNSGQAAVGFVKKLVDGRILCESEDTISNNCLTSEIYYPASVLNSVLGGGYSARLNQEIRLKRGLSYGAGSGFGWRDWDSNFVARAQTKNESAAQVAELMKIEMEKLMTGTVSDEELVPRKAALTGGFGRELQTNRGLAENLRELYLHNISTSELNKYMNNVNSVTDEQLKAFANNNLKGGDIIIVGESKLFMSDLQKRFPNRTIEVIKAADLDLNRAALRKPGRK